jgi:hypothetical protein
MSFVTRRALSTLIPPKVSEPLRLWAQTPGAPIDSVANTKNPGRFSQGTQNTMILFSSGASISIPTTFWMGEI